MDVMAMRDMIECFVEDDNYWLISLHSEGGKGRGTNLRLSKHMQQHSIFRGAIYLLEMGYMAC